MGHRHVMHRKIDDLRHVVGTTEVGLRRISCHGFYHGMILIHYLAIRAAPAHSNRGGLAISPATTQHFVVDNASAAKVFAGLWAW